MANWALANTAETTPTEGNPFSGMTWQFLRNDVPIAEITAQVHINDETIHFIVNVPPNFPEFSITTNLERTFGT